MHLRDDGCRIAKIFVNRLCNDHTEHLAPFAYRLLDPPHIPGQLSNRSIRTVCALEFENKKRIVVVNCQNVDWSDCRRKLNAVAAHGIDVESETPPVDRDRA